MLANLVKPMGARINVADPLARGLVAYYPLNEGIACSGVNKRSMRINDASPQGNHGTYTCADSAHAHRHGSHGVYFDGNDSRVAVPHHNSLSLGKNFTISLWVYNTNAAAANRFVLDKGTAATARNFAINLGTTHTFTCSFYSTGQSRLMATPLANSATGLFHLTATYDFNRTTTAVNTGNSPSDQLLLYVNGVNKVANTGVGSWDSSLSPIANTSQMCIGANSFASGTYAYTGWVNNLGIWNRTLTDSEIKQLYIKGQR